MKYCLILLFCFQTTTIFTQFLIGQHADLLRNHFQEKGISYSENIMTDSTSRIKVEIKDDFDMIYVLDHEGFVCRQSLIPHKENGVNEFVKLFNKDFVIVSRTEWLNYVDDKIIKIKLQYLSGFPLFVITLLSDEPD